MIARLYSFSFFMLFWMCNDKKSDNYIYYKADFIKIIEIFKLYFIFLYYIVQ